MADQSFQVAEPARPVRFSPTDLSQFVRLEQCERYLRIRLFEHRSGQRFFYDYGVRPQPIPELLTRSGRRFEERVESAVGRRFPAVNLAHEWKGAGNRPADNERLAGVARCLSPGDALCLFQARLQVDLGAGSAETPWRLTGDADLLRLSRSPEGELELLIADMKASTSVKVEHRLQVGFYHAILAALFEQQGIEVAQVRTGILYPGSSEAGGAAPDPEEAARLEAQRGAARDLFGVEDALLEIVADPVIYLDSVRDLVTGPDSLAGRVAGAAFDTLPFHLTGKCDGCVNNEFCLKWSAEKDDLSLIPHLTAEEKAALRRLGIETTKALAALKEFRPAEPGEEKVTDLAPAPGQEELCRKIATTWSLGPRIDELVHRARRYRKWRGDAVEYLPYIPSKGYGSLPYCDAEQNPNLVRVYLDAQHDYLHNRLYLVGALVVACEGGQPARRRTIVRMTEGPPDTAEKEERLLQEWIRETLRAVVEIAAPDAGGERRAPVHLIFYNALEQTLFLEGLGRHLASVAAGTPALYDFVTQIAAFDSPIGTFLDQEIRELKNYPMLCQSLQAVAAYLKFDWNQPQPFTRLFRARLFDSWGKLKPPEGEEQWYAARARFGSMIPLEYAYAAWGELDEPQGGNDEPYGSSRGSTIELLKAFHARRLEAMEWIARDFTGNKQTQKRAFDLPDLAAFTGKAATLVQALDEFLTLERHVELGAWKSIRQAAPERRVLAGETLLARYVEEDQEAEVAAQNRENLDRQRLKQEYELAYRAAHPDAERVELTKEEKQASKWSQTGLRFRLRLAADGLDCSLDEALALNTLQKGDRVVVFPRWTEDERLPVDQRARFTPTPRQMLYGTRAAVAGIDLQRDGDGKVVAGCVELQIAASNPIREPPGYVFGAIDRPFVPGEVYTLDTDPNSWYGYYCARAVRGLLGKEDPAGLNSLYDRLTGEEQKITWPAAAAVGQARFLAGLSALAGEGAVYDFEPGKRDYIGGYGDAPLLLVQGPPGTGKSCSTAYALFARLQDALAADRDFRAFVACKTHAATDELLQDIAAVQEQLRAMRAEHPGTWSGFFDDRLLDVPLFRIESRGAVPDGVTALAADGSGGGGKAADVLQQHRWCVAAATPGGIFRTINKKWKDLFQHFICDCLVFDEASQMNLPEAILAALPLKPDASVIVVGDPRQMPPIVKHDWAVEPRRTFQDFPAYESLFEFLAGRDVPMVKFEESFRLHTDMAEFLRQEIYRQDGINFHSGRREILAGCDHEDQFLAAALAPEYPIVIVVHDEADSQKANPFEERLIGPILAALADENLYALDPVIGLGVVVPHRAQRAALRQGHPLLAILDPATGTVLRSAVDTVERFQGGEREAILVSATESDRAYLLRASEFLLDPRRLTVAMSRAKKKLILVAARSIFSLFSADEETFRNSQLWKNLLRRTCTQLLWQGERDGHQVEVWGNVAATERPAGLIGAVAQGEVS